MNAGVVRSKYKKTELDKAVKEYREVALPAIAAHDGARSGTLLVNRETGDAISVAFYESAAAAKAFAPKAEKLIDSFQKYADSNDAPKREVFEVAASTQMEARALIEADNDAFNAHDLERIARDSAADVEVSAPGDVKLKGPQAVKEYYQGWLTAFPDAKAEVKNLIAQGNTVVIEGEFTGTHGGTLKTPMGDVPATGLKVKGQYVQIFDVDRGLIKKIRLTFDQVQLMTQLGLTPTSPQQVAKSR